MTRMQSKATTVAAYLASLPPDRRSAIEAVRKVLLANLDKAYEEMMVYGMIGYVIPHSLYPSGYHCDPTKPICFAGLASQKNHMAIYLMCVYGNVKEETWFRDAWAKTGKKLDMGKACLRFKKIEDVALDVIGEAVKRVPAKKYLAAYEAILGPERIAKAKRAAEKLRGASSDAQTSTAKTSLTKSAVTKTSAKKKVAKKPASKAASKKKVSR